MTKHTKPAAATRWLAGAALALAVGVPGAHAATLTVTDGLVSWYDAAQDTHADAAGTVDSIVGGNVLRWEDQATAIAGNNHVQQQNAPVQPTLQTAGLADGFNGTHNVVRFDGGDNLLALDGGSGLPNQDAFGDVLDTTTITTFIVSRQDTAGVTDRTLGAQVGSQASKWGSFYQNDDVFGHTRTGATFQGSAADTSANPNVNTTEFLIHSTVWDSTNSIQTFVTDNAANFVQGPDNTNGGDSSGLFNRYRLGADSAGGAGLNGDIAEVLIYNQALSGRERAKVEGYLYDKYFRTAPDDVVAYWEFSEGNPGDTALVGDTIVDGTGNHHGTVAGNSLTYVAGDAEHRIGGTGLHFDGGSNTNRVVVADDADFHFTDSFTIESLIRTTDTGTASIISKNGVSGGVSQWWIRLNNNGQLEFLVRGSNAQYLVASGAANTVNDGEWTQFAAVYDALDDLIKLYIDYELVASASTAGLLGAIGDNPDAITIGDFLNGARNYTGDIDYIRISNGALAPAQFLTMQVPTPGALAGGMALLAGLATRRRRTR